MRRISEKITPNSKRNSISFEQRRYSLTVGTPSTTQKLISSVRQRNAPTELDLNPEMASKVVRDYILPMFHTSSKEESHARRRESFGFSKHRRLSSDTTGTLYSELKLSDQLSNEMKRLLIELENHKQIVKELEQKQFELMNELSLCKETIFSNGSIIAMLNQEQALNMKFKGNSELLVGSLRKKIGTFQQLTDELTEEKERMNRKLKEEHYKNDIRLLSFVFLNSFTET
jgi:hypothetical protein